MIRLEDTDLAKALAGLSRLAARAAADIVTELDSPERTYELAAVCEETARLLRERAKARPPRVIDSQPPGLVPRTFSASGPGPAVWEVAPDMERDD